jgi:hypothetical protein
MRRLIIRIIKRIKIKLQVSKKVNNNNNNNCNKKKMLNKNLVLIIKNLAQPINPSNNSCNSNSSSNKNQRKRMPIFRAKNM